MMRKERDFIREKGQDILKQAATGLAFMNAKGWVHRDVKPDNILVNSSGDVRTHRLRPGPASPDRLGQAVSPQGQAAGHAQLHVARADSRPTARWPGRHLQLRRHLLRAGDGPAAVPRGQFAGLADQAHHRESLYRPSSTTPTSPRSSPTWCCACWPRRRRIDRAISTRC